jgi:hypothetical protein
VRRTRKIIQKPVEWRFSTSPLVRTLPQKNKTMTTKEIASRLVDLVRKGEFEKAQQELYAQDAVSMEPIETPEFEKETRGLKAIFEKGQKFNNLVETMHAIRVSDPLVAGNTIACTMTMDVTMKGRERATYDQLCVYQVKDGRVISEQFFV